MDVGERDPAEGGAGRGPLELRGTGTEGQRGRASGRGAEEPDGARAALLDARAPLHHFRASLLGG